MGIDDSIREGYYARKQLFCKDWLISWSHKGRFRVGLELARSLPRKRVLDYGCGDGTFLALLMAAPEPPQAAVGVEVDPSVVTNCRERLGSQPGLTFHLAKDLEAASYHDRFDMIICMEVLEHVVAVEKMLEQFHGLLALKGTLLISVPVEIGFPLIVKQVARKLAGWRGLGDYPGISPYRWRELWTGVFAGNKPHMPRLTHQAADAFQFHDHKGFNWKVIREQLTRRFELERVLSSPVTWFPRQFASQIWFVARRRD